MFPEKRVFRMNDPDAPTTSALRGRMAQIGKLDLSPDPIAPASRAELPAVRTPQASHNFTDAEKAMIRKIHGYVPASQLLGILNDRLRGNLGPGAKPYTAEQLHAEIAKVSAPAANDGTSWASLRKLLATAERTGTLQIITEQVIQDFAIVFSLSAKQAMRLRDILLQQIEED